MKYKDVVATLDYGMRLSKFLLILLWVGLICSIILIPNLIVLYFVEKEIFLIYLMVILPLLVGIVSILSLHHDKLHTKNIGIWLIGSVILTAETQIVYEKTAFRSYRKLQVTFEYNNEIKQLTSRRKVKDQFDSLLCNPKNALQYDTMVSRWGKRKIKILYSPKYDKVMLTDIFLDEEVL